MYEKSFETETHPAICRVSFNFSPCLHALLKNMVLLMIVVKHVKLGEVFVAVSHTFIKNSVKNKLLSYC